MKPGLVQVHAKIIYQTAEFCSISVGLHYDILKSKGRINFAWDEGEKALFLEELERQPAMLRWQSSVSEVDFRNPNNLHSDSFNVPVNPEL